MYLLKAIGIWLLMVLAAIANGLFRESILNAYMGESLALPMSGLLLSILIILIIYLTIDVFDHMKRSLYVTLGFLWVSLTLVFEYGFGFFVQGLSLHDISQVFNVLEGNLFALVMITTLIAPQLIAQYKGCIH